MKTKEKKQIEKQKVVARPELKNLVMISESRGLFQDKEEGFVYALEIRELDKTRYLKKL